MAHNIQEKLNSAQATAFAQLSTQPNTLENYSAGLKNGIKKVGLMSFVAASLFIAGMGNAEAGSTSDTFKVAGGISALVGVLNNGNHAMNLPGVCNIRGVNGTKVAASTFLGSAIGSQFGGGNGTKAWMAALGLLGSNMSLNSENDRIYREMQDCERKLDEMRFMNQNINPQQRNRRVPIQIPNYLVSGVTPEATVFYSFPDKTGRQTLVSWELSPSIKNFKGEKAGKDISKNPKASAEFNEQLAILKNNYKQFENISEQWLKLVTNQDNISKAMNMNPTFEEKAQLEAVDKTNREVMMKASNAFEMAYQNYILNRGNFMAHADSLSLEGFSLKGNADVLKLLQIPKIALDACSCNMVERYNTLSPNNPVNERISKLYVR